MRISITTEQGDFKSLEVSNEISINDLRPIIQAEFLIPIQNQRIIFNNVEIVDQAKSVSSHGISEDDILLVLGAPTPQQNTSNSNSNPFANMSGMNPEALRQQIISNPESVRQITSRYPQLSQALNNPQLFANFINNANQTMQSPTSPSNDFMDVEAQKKIEEMIKKENIAKNMENALEFHPESFARVTMLYIDTFVNGNNIKAFVDSGAQATIMSPECAKACNILHLIDERFAGIAKGVGTAKIIGRVHSAQIKIGTKFLMCSFTIMENKGMDLLFGLDMLLRHQIILDFKSNVFRLGDEDIKFLAEHELPNNAKDLFDPNHESKSHNPSNSNKPSNPSTSKTAAVSQPIIKPNSPLPAAKPSQTKTFPEDTIKMLMDLGFSRDEVTNALQACNGNADLAANLLFQS